MEEKWGRVGVPVERNMKRKHIVSFAQVVSGFSLALTLHGVRLSCPSLSVCKDGAIVSLQHRVHHSPEGLVIQVPLLGAVAGGACISEQLMQCD